MCIELQDLLYTQLLRILQIADSPGPLPLLSGAIEERPGERIDRDEGASSLELNRTHTDVRTANDIGAPKGLFMCLLDSAGRCMTPSRRLQLLEFTELPLPLSIPRILSDYADIQLFAVQSLSYGSSC